MVVISAISLIAMGYVDYITGYELVFSAAYLLPVSLCAWYLGKREVWLMSLAAGFTCWFVDRGHVYTHQSIQYLNSFVCFAISLFCWLLLWNLRRVQVERETPNHELTHGISPEASREFTSDLKRDR
jgi:hypothetical protein